MRPELWTETLEDFAAAPFEPQRWNSGLLGLAEIGSGSGAQLAGASPSTGLTVNWLAGFPAEVAAEFEDRDGGNPAVNPRSAVQFRKLLEPLCDYDLLDEHARSRHPFYRDFLMRVDGSFQCGAVVLRERGFVIATVVLRSERAGHVDAEERDRICRVFPFIGSAVRLHLQLENQGTLAAKGEMDSLSIAAIFCNPWNEAIACSRLAEELLQRENHLRVRNGRIEALHAATNRDLHVVLRQANSADPRQRLKAFDRVVPLSEDGTHLQVAALPRHNNLFGCGASVVTIIKPGRRTPDPDLFRSALGLSRAEAEIVSLLAQGLSLPAIAHRRDTTRETLRTQLKSIYEKMGVRRQAELVAAAIQRIDH